MGRLGRVDEVEDLFMISLAFGQFSIEKAERIVGISGDGGTNRSVGVEEAGGFVPGAADEVIETMARQEEETVIAAGSVQVSQRRC